MKPKIIIIHGPMAAGKSTVTGELMKKLKDYILVDRAYLKDIMLKRVKKKGDKELAKQVSKGAMFFIAKQLMEKKYNLMLQEIRISSVRKNLKKEIEKYNYELKSFCVYCSVEEAKKRDEKRKGGYRPPRPEIIEEKHNLHGGCDKEDVQINTEENSLRKTVNIILKEIK